ncbi:MAG: site-2 protease family protein [Candidatus Colwellbacteria bacterium]|nr:site-2 protease family protein [Candidatus Colwellbacteria bacterium]
MIHEVAHGAMALRLGDDTAKLAGRLTLNPIKHLDVVGSLLFPLFLFMASSPIILGWAKPVPYDPTRLYRDPRYGPLRVALAGPASNIVVALIVAILIRFGSTIFSPEAIAFLGFIVFLNVLLAVFNLIPVPPLDGSKIIATFLPPQAAMAFERIGFLGIFILLFLLFFTGGLGLIYSLSFAILKFLVGTPGITPFLQLFGG